MTFFVDKHGILKQEEHDIIKKYWVARFETKYWGQRQSKCHYCDDYDTLRHFVLNAIKLYNNESTAEGLSGSELDRELIKEVYTDTWESEEVHISIAEMDTKLEDVKPGLLNRILKK